MTVGETFDVRESARRLERDIEKLSQFSSPGPGVTRLTFTPEYRSALDYLEEQFEGVGFEAYYDPVGNFVATNVPAGERCVALGSHVDSVPNGGRFDGTAGVLCALEVARLIPDAPLKVFSFVEEEGSRFGSGILGSRCVVGSVSSEDLRAHTDPDGISFYEAAIDAGHEPDRVAECPANLNGVERYVEVHIEQGRVLEEGGEEIGVVEAIAGLVHGAIEVEGRADHAGATPMDLRSDSGLTAAEVVVELERLVRRIGKTAVGTVGRVELDPGALNVIPGRALVGLDVRDIDEARVDEILDGIVTFARRRARQRGQRITYREHLRTAPVDMARRVVADLEDSCEQAGVSCRRMVSGAGHDAMMIARRAPVGMLFVPSRGGISHSPEEFTQPRHLAQAVAVLLGAVGGR
jgi:hydantoinase/carbamoylase family amidase